MEKFLWRRREGIFDIISAYTYINEAVWLNRHQMAQLFGRGVKTIGKHIANALSEELLQIMRHLKFCQMQQSQNLR